MTGVAWPVAGKPAKLSVDNAAEFHSEAFERLIGTLMRRIHSLPGATFSSTAQRGDYDSGGPAT